MQSSKTGAVKATSPTESAGPVGPDGPAGSKQTDQSDSSDPSDPAWTYGFSELCCYMGPYEMRVKLDMNENSCLFGYDGFSVETVANLEAMKHGENYTLTLDNADGPFATCSVKDNTLKVCFEAKNFDAYVVLPVNTPAAQALLDDFIDAVKQGKDY